MEPTAENREQTIVVELPQPVYTPRLCINCQHIGTNSSQEASRYRCFAPGNVYDMPDLVTGGKRYRAQTCYAARENVGYCGSVGQWWEQRVMVPKEPAYTASAMQLDRAARGKPNADTLLNQLENL